MLVISFREIGSQTRGKVDTKATLSEQFRGICSTDSRASKPNEFLRTR